MKSFIATLKKMQAEANEAKACINDCQPDVIISGASYEYVDNRISSLQNQLDSLWSSFYNHTSDGHLPPIEGAAAMEKALKALGLADDFDVQKKVIYANDGTPETFTVSISPKKTSK